MSLAPLLNAPFAIQLHAFCAMGAFVLGLVQFIAPKGTIPHRLLGYIWFSLMVTIAISSFWIHQINQWQGFSLIHLLSLYTLVALPPALLAARRGKISAHKGMVKSMFFFALVVAGAFTFLPTRIMHKVVTGQTALLPEHKSQNSLTKSRSRTNISSHQR